MWITEKENWFDNLQLVKLITDIEINKNTNKNTVAVVLDIKSAYDNVQTNTLCDILIEKRCLEKIIKYINV